MGIGMAKLKDKSKKIEMNKNTKLILSPNSKNTGNPENLYSSYVVKVSVRQLVEFIFRAGDIDNTRIGSSDNLMLEGSKIHRKIQKSMGDNYYPEFLLKYNHFTERYRIEIEGRADGIIIEKEWTVPENRLSNKHEIALNQHLTDEDYPRITIDEIKCVAKDLEYVKEPVKVHLAQAMLYAYIYATQNSIPLIRVRMTYCQLESLDIKYFHYEYSYAELKSWFDKLICEYIKWADFQYDWYLVRQDSIERLEFPFTYREGQKQLAVYVYQTIKEGKKLYLEAPTGVGKTVSTIFPSVKSLGQGLIQKIFYLTAKTITRTVAEDTFDILRESYLKIKTLTITGKEKICIFEKPECNPAACERAKGHLDRVNDAIYDAIMNYDRIDRSVVERIAEKYRVCPFELSLDISNFADAVILDYNYVFDPHASLKRYFSEGQRGDYVFLIDEAHNLVERGRDMFSAELYKEDLLKLKRTISDELEKQTINKTFSKPSLALRVTKALERCNREMLALKKACDGMVVLEEIDHLVALVESLHTVMSQFLEEEKDSAVRRQVMEYYFEVCHFLMIFEKVDGNYVIYSELKDSGSFKVKLFCVDPKGNIKDACSKGKSSIMFSATLLPIQYYKKLLGGEEQDYEVYAKSTFDNKKLSVLIGNDVTSKYSRRGPLEYNRIASYIYEITRCRQGNYMVFCPSHAFLSEVYSSFVTSYFDESIMNIVIQEERMTEEMREQFLSLFENRDDSKTLIGFCVLGGIFSEGIDLKKDSLIGSIIVGTGIPLVCNEREVLKDHFDDSEGKGFDYAYRYPGMNKVLQAAGRVIRTSEDMGIVALLDDRFEMPVNKRLFPREWESCKIVDNTNVSRIVEDFWNSLGIK